MIKGITGGTNLVVNGGSVSFPYVPMNSNNPIQGMVRVSGQDMQVFDGSAWITMGASYASISLDAEAQDLLQWARTQRQLDLNRKILIKNNPALQKAYESIQRAEANFDILSKFVENDDNSEVQSSP